MLVCRTLEIVMFVCERGWLIKQSLEGARVWRKLNHNCALGKKQKQMLKLETQMGATNMLLLMLLWPFLHRKKDIDSSHFTLINLARGRS